MLFYPILRTRPSCGKNSRIRRLSTFQSAKILDPAARLRIATAPTPGAAKRLWRRVLLRTDWYIGPSFRIRLSGEQPVDNAGRMAHYEEKVED